MDDGICCDKSDWIIYIILSLNRGQSDPGMDLVLICNKFRNYDKKYIIYSILLTFNQIVFTSDSCMSEFDRENN